MRTNIDIDDELLAAAMRITGQPNKKATVEEALRRIVKHHERKEALETLRGLGWEGELRDIRGPNSDDPIWEVWKRTRDISE